MKAVRITARGGPEVLQLCEVPDLSPGHRQAMVRVHASAINRAAGARSRLAPIVAGLVMAVVMVAFGGAVGHLAMPALAGLLILIGVRTVKPADLRSVWRTGNVQKAVLVVTFVLTLLDGSHGAAHAQGGQHTGADAGIGRQLRSSVALRVTPLNQ